MFESEAVTGWGRLNGHQKAGACVARRAFECAQFDAGTAWFDERQLHRPAACQARQRRGLKMSTAGRWRCDFHGCRFRRRKPCSIFPVFPLRRQHCSGRKRRAFNGDFDGPNRAVIGPKPTVGQPQIEDDKIRRGMPYARDRVADRAGDAAYLVTVLDKKLFREIGEHEVVLNNQDLEHAQSSSLRSDQNSERSCLGDSRSGLPRDARPRHLNNGDERAVSPPCGTNRPLRKWFPQFGTPGQNFTWDVAAWKRNLRLRGEQLARTVKKVWSILIMARVHI